MQVLIHQARVCDKRSGFHDKVVDILIEDGIIKDIAASLNVKADQVIEAEGLCVSPGWVDIIADYSEPGYEHKETIATGLKAAAAGGFTHVLLAPNTKPAISTKSVVEFVQQKAQGSAVSLHPLGAVSQDIEGKNLAEMLDMHSHGAVAFTDGWKPVQNAQLMLKALEYVKAFDGTIIQIPADASLSAGGLMHESFISTKLGMPGIPALAETILLHRDIELLRYTGSRLHVNGISTATGVDMIRAAKAEGLHITCSVTPYHLVLNDEALETYSSMYKVMPPLRSEADRLALVAGVLDGTIDAITSHHRPHEWDAKTKEFEYASDGMNIQEVAFSIALQAINPDRLTAALTAGRAIFGLGTTHIDKGSAADITLFTTAGKWTMENMQSAARNNPFIGKELNGKVIGIINNRHIHLNK
jgi:dihydroorotase